MTTQTFPWEDMKGRAKSRKRHSPSHRAQKKVPGELSAETQVAVPQEVDIPLPTSPEEQIAVPASINGRDLSKGGP